MRLSLGSAAVLGLTDEQVDVLPTTCYILFGDKCINDCAFCTQAKNSAADADKLSRVTWPEFDDKEVHDRMIDACADGKIWRACIQATSGNFLEVLDFVEQLNVPLSISIDADEKQVDRLIAAGVENVTIAIDAVTEPLYKKIKGKADFYEKLDTLKNSAAKHPRKIGTHLIAGLGETEQEITGMIKWMYEHGINVALFAFTPVKGTRMQNNPAPDIKYYRKIQAAHYKIKHKTDEISPQAFKTSGCNGCNRPYYNESPGGIMYNYPRKLTDEEFQECLNDIKDNV